LALGIFVLLLSIILYFAPRIFRAVRIKLWLIWKKLNGPAESDETPDLPIALSSRAVAAFARENLLGETVAWAVPCISKRLRGVPANSSGTLIATNEDPAKLIFVARKGWGSRAQTIHLGGCRVAREPKFLSENLVIAPDSGKGETSTFLFERGCGARVQQIVESFNDRLSSVETAPEAVPST
jgi:hypothetical protein